jgi:hypothetical protein
VTFLSDGPQTTRVSENATEKLGRTHLQLLKSIFKNPFYELSTKIG